MLELGFLLRQRDLAGEGVSPADAVLVDVSCLVGSWGWCCWVGRGGGHLGSCRWALSRMRFGWVCFGCYWGCLLRKSSLGDAVEARTDINDLNSACRWTGVDINGGLRWEITQGGRYSEGRFELTMTWRIGITISSRVFNGVDRDIENETTSTLPPFLYLPFHSIPFYSPPSPPFPSLPSPPPPSLLREWAYLFYWC